MTFEQFAAGPLRSTWLQEPGLGMYVRKAWGGIRGPGIDFELASLDATHPGCGALTRFLDRYEPLYGFYVENILNPRLIGYLTRRGYEQLEQRGHHDINMARPRRRTA